MVMMNKLAKGLKLIHEHFAGEHSVNVEVNVNIFYHDNKNLDYQLAEKIAEHSGNILISSVKELGNTLETGNRNNKIQLWYIKETHPDFLDKEKQLYEKLKAKYA